MMTSSERRRGRSTVLAMVIKEIREFRRDRRTLAMMIFLPVLLIVVFGYAANFGVTSIPVTVTGPNAQAAAAALPSPFAAAKVIPGGTRADAVTALRNGNTPAALLASPPRVTLLLDGSSLFTAQAALRALAGFGKPALPGARPRVQVLFNPQLKTSDVMVPGLTGLILLFVGTVITSLGVVRERQSGTLEQLAVMPLRPVDVFLGKIAPYFAVGLADMAIVVLAGVTLFGVPFAGSPGVFALGAVLFLFVALGIGVLISSVSQNQGQAIQLAIMMLLPQVMLSGLIFPLSSMAAGVRWIGYVLPLTYFIEIARAVMLRGTPIGALWQPLVYLTALGTVVLGLATLRFRRMLAPARRHHRPGRPGRADQVAEPEAAL
jgi:ABC-2 type transport system permease protein